MITAALSPPSPADFSPPLLLLFMPTLVSHGHTPAFFGPIYAEVGPPLPPRGTIIPVSGILGVLFSPVQPGKVGPTSSWLLGGWVSVAAANFGKVGTIADHYFPRSAGILGTLGACVSFRRVVTIGYVEFL